MELYEYGELISIFIPTGAKYVAMDKKFIQVFDGKPHIEQINDKSFKWVGAKCLGWVKYWDGFIDLDYITDPVDNKVDWYLACEEVEPKPWDIPRTLQKWAECLDAVLPYDSRFASVDGSKIEFWGKIPFLNEKKGVWEGSGGRLPHAAFSYPRELVYTRDPDKVINTPDGLKLDGYSADGPRFQKYQFRT